MKCPSCGQEIPDDVDICPYCTAHVRNRVRIKAIYAVALTLIIVASAYSFFAFAESEVPVSKIGDLGITQNYNFVHIRGTVVNYPKAYESNYGITQVSFTVDDGTGQITVKLYRDQIQRMEQEKKVPAIGDTVDAQGTFSYGTRKSLTINNIEFLKITHGKYHGLSLKKLATAPPWGFKNGELISVSGNITGVSEYSFGYIATIDDSVDLLVPQVYCGLKMVDIGKVSSGTVRFYGSLEFYQSKKQSSDYKAVEMREVMKNPESYNRTNVFVSWGEIKSIDSENGKIIVEQNGTEFTVYTYHSLKYLHVGDHVQLQGKFVNYHGMWEISVTRKTDFITEPRWEIIMAPKYDMIEKKEYGSIGDLDLHSLVKVEGKVADYRTLSYGYLITLWYSNHSYSVYVENKKSIHGTLDYGSEIVVKGMVTYYNGAPEIKVRAFTHDDVEVVS